MKNVDVELLEYCLQHLLRFFFVFENHLHDGFVLLKVVMSTSLTGFQFDSRILVRYLRAA